MNFNTLTDYLTPRNLIIAAVALGIAIVWAAMRPAPLVEAGPFEEPRQTTLSPFIDLPAPPGYQITATDEYSVEAMIMSRSRYWFGEDTSLSPVDFLLAWGNLTIEPNLSGIEWSQSDRWGYYHYKFDNVNLEGRSIAAQSANTHIIPAPDRPDLRRALLKMRRGDVARLKGYLVQVRGPGGFTWDSSRTRTDTGIHSCEVFYVTEMD